MKAFRRSFGKTTTFKHMFMPFLIPLLLFFIFYDYNLNSVAWCYLLLVVLIFLIALIFQLFYILLPHSSVSQELPSLINKEFFINL